MKNYKPLISASVIMIVLLISSWKMNPAPIVQQGAWVAPAGADKIVNPFRNDEAATAEGKKLFKQMCAICHGNAGKGDGMAGQSLKPRPSNFTDAAIQGQSDGALFWKMTEGRTPMAAYKNILKEEQRWQLVNYIRTLKK